MKVDIYERNDFERLEAKVDQLTHLLNQQCSANRNLPEWVTYEQACEYKGINPKTAANKRYLQPNKGIPDGKIGGRRCWHRTTIEIWLLLTDDALLSENKGGSND